MTTGSGHPAPGGWRRTLLVVALAAAALAPGVLRDEPMPPDEPRFAVVTREMFSSGDWLLPARFGEPYLDKPPLLFWCGAALFVLAGEPSAPLTRVAPLLASLLLVAAAHRAGRRWLGEPHATVGAVLLASSVLFLLRGSWLTTDALLSCAAFGAIYAATRAGEGPGWRVLFGVAVGLGLLAKGPVVLVFVALAWAAGLVPGARGPRLGPLVSPAALAALAAVLAPWLIALAVTGRLDDVAGAAWHHTVHRYADSWDNLEPWWYHLPQLFYGLAPWSVLVLPALLSPGTVARTWKRAEGRWLMALLGLAVLFFSIPDGKRGVYLLPVYPAAAMLGALLASDLLSTRWPRRLSAALGTLFTLLAGALAVRVAWPGGGGAPLPAEIASLPVVRTAAVVLLALLAASFAVGTVGVALGRRWWIVGPALFAAGSGLIGPALLTPALDAAQGGRAFGEQVRQAVPPGVPLGLARNKREVVAWFAHPREAVPLHAGPDAAAHFLGRPGRQAVAGTRRELGEPDRWPAGTRVAAEGRVGRDTLVVLIESPD